MVAGWVRGVNPAIPVRILGLRHPPDGREMVGDHHRGTGENGGQAPRARPHLSELRDLYHDRVLGPRPAASSALSLAYLCLGR